MKKVLVRLLCLALCALLVWGGVRLVRLLSNSVGGYRFVVLEDGTAEIRKYLGRDIELAIPAEVKGHAVSRIGAQAFSWRFYVTRAEVPAGVRAIDEGAFVGCAAMTEVALPRGLASLGARAFARCVRLTDVALPEGLAALGGYAFDGCSGLTRVSIPDTLADVGDNPFSGCRRLGEVAVADGHPALELTEGALCGREDGRLIWCPYALAAGEYAVPEGVRAIGGGAFRGCDRLTVVRVPDGVTEIQGNAFSDCAALAEAVLPAGLKAIGSAAFSGCARLSRIDIPDGVERIGYLAFYNCRALGEIAIPASVTEIGGGAFIGCRDLVVTVARGSYAETYCKNNDLRFAYAD